VFKSNPPLSVKALMYQQFLESKQNDTTMNVPGDNVVADVISPGGVGSYDESDGSTVLSSNYSLSWEDTTISTKFGEWKGWKVQD
jgi:hypothetical protein